MDPINNFDNGERRNDTTKIVILMFYRSFRCYLIYCKIAHISKNILLEFLPFFKNDTLT